MKIYIPNNSKQEIGGGWSFRQNLIDGLRAHEDAQVVSTVEESDVVFLTSSTMIEKHEVANAVSMGKKIILRVDNIPRNSRNRNTGTSRLQSYAEKSHRVVFQSEWSRGLLGQWLGVPDAPIITNGVDLTVFNTQGNVRKFDGDPVYLFSRFNRDENKRWEEVWYTYQNIHYMNPKALLVIVGQFTPDLAAVNFDFFRGERVEFLGVINNRNQMADIMRGCNFMFAPYYMDCYSNTYLEALGCGVQLFNPSMTGGTPQMLEENKPGQVKSHVQMSNEYYELFEEVIKQ